MKALRDRWKDLLAAGFCLALAYMNAAPILRHMIDIDSATFAMHAFYTLHPSRIHPHFFCHSLSILGFQLPLRYSVYHGPMMAYTYLPFVALWPPPAMTAIHAYVLFYGGVLTAATYQTSLQLYQDRWSAFLSACLLCACPGFTAQGLFYTGSCISVPALGMTGLCLLIRYADARKPWMAIAGFGCLGWAMGSLSWFLSFLCGLALFAALNARATLRLLPAESSKRLGIIGACFAAFSLFTAAPTLILITTEGTGLGFIAESFPKGSPEGFVKNYIHGLWAVLGQLDQIYFNDMKVPVFLLLLAAAALTAWPLHASARPSARRRLLPSIVCLGGLLVMPLSPNGLNVVHPLALLSLICIIIGSLPSLEMGRAWRFGASLFVLLFSLSNAYSTVSVRKHMEAELIDSGIATHDLGASTMAQDLCRWMIHEPPHPTVSLTPYLQLVLNYCTAGKLDFLNDDHTEPYPDAANWTEWLNNQDIYYLCVKRGAKYTPLMDAGSEIWDQFRAAVAGSKARKRLKEIKVFLGPNGFSGFAVYQVLPAPARP